MENAHRTRLVTHVLRLAAIGLALLASGCSLLTKPLPQLPPASGDTHYSTRYRIAPGDMVQIFVWRNPEVSATVPVRPDGLLSAPLLEDVPAAGKTPAELARDLEAELSTYIRDPLVTVIVNSFVGTYAENIRVIGESRKPISILYRNGMTLLDVMAATGGLTKFADGNAAVLIRTVDGKRKEYRLRLDDLVRHGDISANVDMRPGDIIIIPEAWF